MEDKHLKYALQLIELKKYKEALQQLQEIMETSPPSSETMMLMATCYFNLKEDEKGIKLTKSALALNPNDAHAHWRAGVYYLKKEDYDSSEKHFKIAATLEPNDEKIKASLSALYLVTGKDEEREREINEAIKQAPENPKTLNLKADYFNLEGNHYSAARFAEMALAKNPHNASYHQTAAEAFINIGNEEKAKYHFTQAVLLNPNNSDYRNNLIDYSIRKFSFLRKIYPPIIFLALENTMLYGAASLCFIGLMIAGAIATSILPIETSLAAKSIVLVLVSLYLALPYLNRVVGSWIKWGMQSYKVSLKILYCHLNLQLATWALFLHNKQNIKGGLAFDIALFCILYGLPFGMYDANDKKGKSLILITYMIWYLLGTYAIFCKMNGETISKSFMLVLALGLIVPFYSNPKIFKNNNSK